MARIAQQKSGWNSLLSALDPGFKHAFVGPKASDISIYMDKLVSTNPPGTIAMIPTAPTLFDDLTIADNIYLKDRRYYWFKHHSYVARCQKIFDEAGIEMQVCRKYGELSIEQKRIVDIMWAVINRYPVIVLNDTFAHIKKYAVAFNQILTAAKNNGQIVLYFTSKWEDATRVADQIHVIVNGIHKAIFSSIEVKRNPYDLICALYELKDFSSKQDEWIERTLFNEYGSLFMGAEHFTSGFEMNDTFARLTQSVTQSLAADGCVLYIQSTSMQKNVYYPYYAVDSEVLLKKGVVAAFLSDTQEKSMFFSVLDHGFADLFQNGNENMAVQCVHCVPIVLKSERIGMLQINYNKYVAHSHQMSVLLNRFCYEISLMVEMARLMNRSLLLNESHHRIKNNLQMVISLLTMQKSFFSKSASVDYEDIIDSTIQRIRSIASIHDMLTHASFDSGSIALKAIIEKTFLFYSCNTGVHIHMDVQDIFISYKKATSIALILNELICNSFKYAFDEGDQDKQIMLSAYRDSDRYRIAYRDNGHGLDEGFTIETNANFGLSIVKLIVEKEFLGTIAFSSDHGLNIDIVIPYGRLQDESVL